MNPQIGLFFFILTTSGVLSLDCYTCLNLPLHECMKTNQTCRHGMNKCFSMQKKSISGSYRYSKYCAGEWECERYHAACDDLDEPEYSYLDCNVGCCTSHLCNHGDGTLVRKTHGIFIFAVAVIFTLYLQL